MKFKPSYILITSLFLLALGGLLYRNSAVSTQSQVTAIMANDKAGKPVDAQIKKLTVYTKAHMNAATSFALQGSYSRAYSTAQAAALQQTKAGAQVYSDAQANCSAKVDSIQLSNCVTNYIATHSTPNQAVAATVSIDKNQFIRTLKSPVWTWDSSGVFIIIGALCLALYILLMVVRVLIPKYH